MQKFNTRFSPHKYTVRECLTCAWEHTPPLIHSNQIQDNLNESMCHSWCMLESSSTALEGLLRLLTFSQTDVNTLDLLDTSIRFILNKTWFLNILSCSYPMAFSKNPRLCLLPYQCSSCCQTWCQGGVNTSQKITWQQRHNWSKSFWHKINLKSMRELIYPPICWKL